MVVRHFNQSASAPDQKNIFQISNFEKSECRAIFPVNKNERLTKNTKEGHLITRAVSGGGVEKRPNRQAANEENFETPLNDTPYSSDILQ
jgi:hypothetical protein